MLSNGNLDDLSAYVAMAGAMSRMSYQGVYLYDFACDRFLFASDSTLLHGLVAHEEFVGTGMSAIPRIVPQEEIEAAERIETALRSGFHQLPTDVVGRVVLMFSIHVLGLRPSMVVTHKISILECDADGLPRLALGLVSPSTQNKVCELRIYFDDLPDVYRFNIDDGCWHKEQAVLLSDDECTMLRLTMQGYGVDQIADKMCRSANTVKFYRKQVFQKMGVHNISEAISFAIQNCLI